MKQLSMRQKNTTNKMRHNFIVKTIQTLAARPILQLAGLPAGEGRHHTLWPRLAWSLLLLVLVVFDESPLATDGTNFESATRTGGTAFLPFSGKLKIKGRVCYPSLCPLDIVSADPDYGVCYDPPVGGSRSFTPAMDSPLPTSSITTFDLSVASWGLCKHKHRSTPSGALAPTRLPVASEQRKGPPRKASGARLRRRNLYALSTHKNHRQNFPTSHGPRLRLHGRFSNLPMKTQTYIINCDDKNSK